MSEEVIDKDVAAIAKIDAVQKILEVVNRTTGLGFSAVARVTESKWIACAVNDQLAFGLKPGSELELETTICHEIRQSGKLVVIDHVSADKNFATHPTPKMYGFESYLSVPIRRADGSFFGTLCALDPKPAQLNTPAVIGMFKLFAELIAMHLDAHDRMDASEAELVSERENTKLREQFIAVLGHDLRNPLGAINSGAVVLRELPQTERATRVLDIMQRSAARMTGLISDVLDFARGRLGDGIGVQRIVDTQIGPVLEQIVSELQTAWPQRKIERSFNLSRPIACDSARLGQMLSNLIANALTHGDANSPVLVHAQTSDKMFELSVSNRGEAIPAAIVAQLFQPFWRGAAKTGQEGLGLGLYIASEIARAHEGTLTVESNSDKTTFTFRMPLQPR